MGVTDFLITHNETVNIYKKITRIWRYESDISNRRRKKRFGIQTKTIILL